MGTTHRHPASTGAKFRAAVVESQPLQVVSVITAYTAKIAEQTGFKAVYLSGGGVTANSLDTPGLNTSTMGDVLTDARCTTDAVQVPLMAGIGTGWGGAFNIVRTIHSFTKVDVVVVYLEGQVGQKRCGHRPGEEVVSTDEMVDRVKATADARIDDDFIIMVRIDAAASEGIDAAIEHAVAYVEAGADTIFPEVTKTLNDYRRFKAVVKVPILANLTEFDNMSPSTTDKLRSANMDVVLYCRGAYRAMSVVVLNFYQTVMRDGTQKAAVETMQLRADLYQYLGYHVYEDKFDALFAAQK